MDLSVVCAYTYCILPLGRKRTRRLHANVCNAGIHTTLLSVYTDADIGNSASINIHMHTTNKNLIPFIFHRSHNINDPIMTIYVVNIINDDDVRDENRASS